jgi:hypothetical protein
MNEFLLRWAGSVLLAAGLGCFGYWAGDHNRNNAWLAKQGALEQAARLQLQAAQAHGDALTRSLLQQQGQIDVLKQEAHRAITQATSGRTCLDGAALRVLNSAPGITVDLPTPASGVAAAGEQVSTDTDIALWAADTGAAYETCRARLDALIDWNTAP